MNFIPNIEPLSKVNFIQIHKIELRHFPTNRVNSALNVCIFTRKKTPFFKVNSVFSLEKIADAFDVWLSLGIFLSFYFIMSHTWLLCLSYFFQKLLAAALAFSFRFQLEYLRKVLHNSLKFHF